MPGRTHIRSGGLLFLAACAGGVFLVIPIVGWPAAVMLRGFLLGIAGGLFGACLFAAGYALARDRAVTDRPSTTADIDEPTVRSTAEAKYWLRKFLEEHRVTEQGREDPRLQPGTKSSEDVGQPAPEENLANQ